MDFTRIPSCGFIYLLARGIHETTSGWIKVVDFTKWFSSLQSQRCDSIGLVHGPRPTVELMDSKWSLSALSGNKPNGHYNSYRSGNISLTSLQDMLENYPDITFRLQPCKNLLQAKLLVNLVHRPSTLKKSSDQNGWRARMHCNLCGLRHVLWLYYLLPSPNRYPIITYGIPSSGTTLSEHPQNRSAKIAPRV